MAPENAIGRFMKYSLLFLTLLLFISAGPAAAQPDAPKQVSLKTIEVDLIYCIKFNFENPNYIFKTTLALESALRPYNNADICGEKIKDIDFSRYTLLGVDIYNGECHSFPMEHKVIKDEAAKLYRFQVTHPQAKIPCAGIYHHELWVLAPKLPEGYDVVFEITEKKPEKEHEN
jgi:hypothetical protein